MDNVLESIKDAAGVSLEDTAFDSELLLHINSVFMILRQLGVGPISPFVADGNSTWDEFTSDNAILPMIKSYVALKVRELFDPPASNALAQMIHETIAEYEWRLNLETDPQEGQ